MEQIHWIFSLYDINRDGMIEIEEILEVMKAVEVMGVKQEQLDNIISKFNEMDVNRDGMLTITEFSNGCLDDTSLLKAIGLLKWNVPSVWKKCLQWILDMWLLRDLNLFYWNLDSYLENDTYIWYY